MTPARVLIEQIAVEPRLIEITETQNFRAVGFCVDILPIYFKCTIRITPYVIQRLLQWLLTNHYIHLNGSLTIPIRGRKHTYVE